VLEMYCRFEAMVELFQPYQWLRSFAMPVILCHLFPVQLASLCYGTPPVVL